MGIRRIAALTVPLLAASALVASLTAAPATADGRADAAATDARIAAAVAALPDLTRAAMAQTGAPGAAVAVVHNGQMVYAEGFGVRDVDTGQPVTRDTVFQLASFSKSIGAAVVAAAIGDGVATWDTEVRTLMPWFALDSQYVTSNVTVGDLYTMVSGLPGGAGDVLELVGYNRTQVLKRLRYLPLSPFRTAHQYTNFGLTAAAEAVAEAAGKPWATLSQQLLYGPLGMTSTSSRYSDFLAQPDRASLHVLLDGRMQSVYTRDPDAQSPAGGVSSNVVDLSRWMAMELDDGMYRGDRVVAAAPLGDAQTAHSRTTPSSTGAAVPSFYGYGMGVVMGQTHDVRLVHSGAFTNGAGTAYLMIPSMDVGIVVLANAMVGLPEIVTTSFGDLVETGAVTQDWASVYMPMFRAYYAPNPELEPGARPANPAPSRRLASYVGTYRNPFWGRVDVVKRRGVLRVLMGPDQVQMPLEPWDGDEFVGTFGAGSDWPNRVAVVFAGGGRGQAQTMELVMGPSQVGLLNRVS